MKDMNETELQKLFLHLKSNVDYKNFRFLLSGKLSTALILRYLIKENKINHKLSEILVPKLMGTWVYSNISQNIQIATSFSKFTKILYLYHQFGIPQHDNVKKYAEENNLLIIEDCAHVLKANFNDGKSDIFNSKYSVLSFSKFINCEPLGGLYSSDQNFLKYLDNEINQSSKLQSIIINTLVKLSKLLISNKLLYQKLYSINYSLWNFPSQTLKNKIKVFNRDIETEMKNRNDNFNLLKNEIKEKNYLNYFNYDELVCQKLPLVVENKKMMEKIIDKFDYYKFPYEILIYDENRNFLNPKFEKTIILDHTNKNLLFEKQVELLRKLM